MGLNKIILLILVSLNLCCRTGAAHDYTDKAQGDKSHGVADIKSRVTDLGSGSWKANTLEMPERQNLNSICFSDPQNGWIGGNETFYKTSDGGLTWKRANLDVPKRATVSDIVCSGQTKTWVALNARVDTGEKNYRQDHFRLICTQDGGGTFQSHAEGDGRISNVIFARNTDEQEGWVTITKYVSSSSSQFQIFHTTDGGVHWIDVTTNLNAIRLHQPDIVRGLVNNETSSATILTLKGDIFNTTSGGKVWRKMDISLGDDPQGSFSRLGITKNGYLWLAGGAWSTEGTFGQIGVGGPDKPWKLYHLPIFIVDTIFVSDQQVFACGLDPGDERQGRKKQDTQKPGEFKPGGVILYSSDGGQNWSIIYHSGEEDKPITKLYVIDSRHLWAVGEGGLVVRLESTQ